MEIGYKAELTKLIDPLIHFATKAREEIRDLLEIGLDNYLNEQTKKYYEINTFIHRQEKVKFYDIYYPISASYKSKKFNFSNLKRVIGSRKFISIIGAAGSGKSTLTKFIYLNSILHRFKIPILIELRTLNETDLSVENYILKIILDNKVKENEGILLRNLRKGNFLFILDGYDEIYSNNLSKVNNQISQFVDTYSKNSFIITSRPGAGAETIPRFKTFLVEPLSKVDINGFVSKIVESQERKSNIHKTLRDNGNEQYLSIVSNPLMLSMFIVTFEKYPSIPQLKSIFYSNVWDTLTPLQDGITKNSLQRKPKSSLKDYELREVVNMFSYSTFFRGTYEFSREDISDLLNKIREIIEKDFQNKDLVFDLETTTSIWIQDGLTYKFPHRSLQEYFCCTFMKNLPENEKEECFQRFTNELMENSNDNYLNFLEMYKEIDEVGLNRHFYKKIITEFLEKLNTENSKTLLASYIKTLGIKIQYCNVYKREGAKLNIRITNDLNKRYWNFFNYIDLRDQFSWLAKAINTVDVLKPLNGTLLRQIGIIENKFKAIPNKKTEIVINVFDHVLANDLKEGVLPLSIIIEKNDDLIDRIYDS